jgi:hypothetical protein
MVARWAADSRGRSHYLLHQEMSQSCGPACVAMAESFYKLACMLDPEARARELSQNYPGRFTATGGTGADNLAYVLNAEGVPTYRSTGVDTSKIFDYFWKYIGERTKIIAHVAWSGGGGHFTLLKQIDADHTMIFLDPWYDVVEVARARLPNYNVGGASGTLSGWLTITHR